MTHDAIDDLALPRPAPARRARPARRPVLRPRRGSLPTDRPRSPGLRHLHRHPHRGPPARRTASATRSSARSRTSGPTSRRSRRSTSRACRPRRAFERDLEIHNVRRDLFDSEVQRLWERRSTALDGIGDPLFALFARDFAPLAERLDAMTSRLEAAPRLPRTEQVPRRRPPGPAVADHRDRDGRRDPGPVRRDRRRRRGRPRARREAPARRGDPGDQDRGRRLSDLARGHARRRERRLGARARALRRAGRRCARSTGSMPTRSWPSARSSSS